MEGNNKKCFVCNQPVDKNEYTLNQQVNLPVCKQCKGNEKEKSAANELLDSLADGLICGCI